MGGAEHFLPFKATLEVMAVGVMTEQRFVDVRSRRDSMDSFLSQQRMHPLTVEIEPSRGKREGLPTGLWLPSPVHSMLGPKKTLNLVGGAVAGQRRSRRPLRGPRRYSAYTEEDMDNYPSLHPEEHCSLPSPTANISFLRLKSETNPKTVQGARNERTQLLISPEQRHTNTWRAGKVVGHGEHSPHHQLKPPLRLLSMYVDEEDSIVSSDGMLLKSLLSMCELAKLVLMSWPAWLTGTALMLFMIALLNC